MLLTEKGESAKMTEPEMQLRSAHIVNRQEARTNSQNLKQK